MSAAPDWKNVFQNPSFLSATLTLSFCFCLWFVWDTSEFTLNTHIFKGTWII